MNAQMLEGLCNRREMAGLSITKQFEVYISVGSNIEPEENIPKALDKLKKYVRVVATSTFYRTRPIGRPEQAFFLNGVWLIETNKAPQELRFRVLRIIEEELGRIRTEDKYAPRTIDLDIILYGNAVIRGTELVIPDPDIRRRNFIAIPLLELNPSLVLPDTGKPISSLDIVKSDKGLTTLHAFTESLRERIGT